MEYLIKAWKENPLVFLGLSLVVIYGVFMCIIPWFDDSWSTRDWKHVHGVWHDWQTLNAGVLAVLASLYVAHSVRKKEKRKEEIQYQAAKTTMGITITSIDSEYLFPWSRVLADNHNHDSEPVSKNIEFKAIELSFFESVNQSMVLSTNLSEAKWLSEFLWELNYLQHGIQVIKSNSEFKQDNSIIILRLIDVHAMCNRISEHAKGKNLNIKSISKEERCGSPYTYLLTHVSSKLPELYEKFIDGRDWHAGC